MPRYAPPYDMRTSGPYRYAAFVFLCEGSERLQGCDS
jgi:hypothetical protein